MIGLSKKTQDASGAILITENYNSKIYDAAARVSRQGTLDGGVVIDHQGVVAGDRTLAVRCTLSETELAVVKTLFENETYVIIATETGCYTGVISRLSGDYGDFLITLMIKE